MIVFRHQIIRVKYIKEIEYYVFPNETMLPARDCTIIHTKCKCGFDSKSTRHCGAMQMFGNCYDCECTGKSWEWIKFYLFGWVNGVRIDNLTNKIAYKNTTNRIQS